MIKRLMQFFVPPSFPGNETKTHQAALLHAILLVSLTMAILYTVSVPFAYKKTGIYLAVGLTLILIDTILFLRVRYGRLKQIAMFYISLRAYPKIMLSKICEQAM